MKLKLIEDDSNIEEFFKDYLKLDDRSFNLSITHILITPMPIVRCKAIQKFLPWFKPRTETYLEIEKINDK